MVSPKSGCVKLRGNRKEGSGNNNNNNNNKTKKLPSTRERNLLGNILGKWNKEFFQGEGRRNWETIQIQRKPGAPSSPWGSVCSRTSLTSAADLRSQHSAWRLALTSRPSFVWRMSPAVPGVSQGLGMHRGGAGILNGNQRIYDHLLHPKQTCWEPTTCLGIGKEKPVSPWFISELSSPVPECWERSVELFRKPD